MANSEIKDVDNVEKSSDHSIGQYESRPLWTYKDSYFKHKAKELESGKKDFIPEERPKIAVIVTHGMGQQLPFQTMSRVMGGLCDVDGKSKVEDMSSCGSPTIVRYGESKLERIEMTLTGEDGKEVDVHLFETYWAPLTEGTITIIDTISFLIRAGTNGIRNSRGFWRWMFGGKKEFGSQNKAAYTLILALSVVVALVLINAVVAIAGGAVILGRDPSGWLGGTLLTSVTWLLGLWLLSILISSIGAYKSKNMRWLNFSLCTTIAVGIIIVLFLISNRFTQNTLSPSDLASKDLSIIGNIVFFFFWLVLLWISYKIKNLLVQYLGDVAVYVLPHHLDRFSKIRESIKHRVENTANAIYKALNEETNFEYQNLAFVGHSLGSVIAYDALNSLINEDRLSQNQLKIVERTCLLLTFGSPLDKITFNTAPNRNTSSVTQEKLNALGEPLILDYQYRDFPWINIYSKKDVISGELDFYDPPKSDGDYNEERAVKNIEDEESNIPVYAHIQYWDNQLVFEKLHETLTEISKKSSKSVL